MADIIAYLNDLYGYIRFCRADYLLMLEKEMSSFMATLSLKWRGIEEYVNLTLQTEPSVINFIFRDGLPAD